jgi:hypothetical protein
MRGPDTFTEGLFTMRRLDDFVPADHPLRRLRVMVNEALAKMDGLFSRMYEADIRPSIAPEKLLRAMLLQFLFSIRSERQLMEQTPMRACGLLAVLSNTATSSCPPMRWWMSSTLLFHSLKRELAGFTTARRLQ